jgi:MOSC domain-containing protein YiiM
MRLGPATVEVTQIGKECHDRCAIYFSVGDCVMPREGIFVRVLEGGRVAAGDGIELLGSGAAAPAVSGPSAGAEAGGEGET